jgi:hypothetical protein
MPELANEYPSRQELWEYFLQNCQWVREDYTPTHLTRPYQLEAYYRFEGRLLELKMGEVIWDALNALDRLDRNNSFWVNTNRRPTLYKLTGYARLRLREDGFDELGLWTLAMLDSFYGANQFGQQWWKRLAALGKLEVKWPILAALRNEVEFGMGRSELAALLVEIGTPLAAFPVLRDAARAELRRFENGLIQY